MAFYCCIFKQWTAIYVTLFVILTTISVGYGGSKLGFLRNEWKLAVQRIRVKQQGNKLTALEKIVLHNPMLGKELSEVDVESANEIELQATKKTLAEKVHP